MGLFFILLFSIFQNAFADDIKKASESNRWKALLYYQNHSFAVTDPNFYLTKERTLESELRALLNALNDEDSQKTICRFPARYFFVAHEFGHSIEALDRCDLLKEFQMKAPFEKVSVVFASENISIPSSMMGHVYLKFSGLGEQKNNLQHAISFYTDVDGFNFPKLVIESLILGKKGYYSLSPSEPIKEKYLYEEGRNVWEFELNLSDYDKKILQYHLLELKKIKLTYYFHTFNCATLIQHVLLVGNPIQDRVKFHWVYPLDVVRFIYQENMIKNQTVSLSNKWKIKSLLESNSFSRQEIRILKVNNLSHVIEKSKEMNDEKAYQFLEVSKSYNDYLKEDSLPLTKYLDERFPDTTLDLSEYKNPTGVRSTSQVAATFLRENKEDIYKISWLPASHMLEDESSNYLGESELQISKVALALNPQKGGVYIDEILMYSASSYQPSDELTGGLSGTFKLGYTNYFNSSLEKKKSLLVKGSLGKSYRIHRDIDIYGLTGISYYENNDVMFSPDGEIGFIIRGVLKMKTIVSLNYSFEDIFKEKLLINYKIRHFIPFGDYGINLEYNKFQDNYARSIESYSLGVKRYF